MGLGAVSLRSFDPETDTTSVYKWMSQEFEGPLKGKSIPPPALQECYAAMLESDMAQPFIGTVNDIPVCQINICHVKQDILSLSYHCKPGDFAIQLVMAPLSIQDNMVTLLQNCLEYAFSFSEVDRMVVDIDDRNDWLHNLFTRAGFRAGRKLHGAFRNSQLMFCTRTSLKRGVKQKLLTGGH